MSGHKYTDPNSPHYQKYQAMYDEFEFKAEDLKNKYIEFVELLRAARTKSFGKTGFTQVKVPDMLAIVPCPQVNVFLANLARDGVIESMNKDYIDFYEIMAFFKEVDPSPTIEIQCLMTADEILAYRHQLQGKPTDSVTFPISSWLVLEMRFITDQRVLLTAHESAGVIQNDYAYDELGFANKKDGRPNMEWAFLYLLAKNEGVVSPSNPDVKDRANMKKRKQLLKDHLQRIFCQDTDPFFDYRDNQQYELRFQISVSDQHKDSMT
jgi:hypothetical protein